MAGRVAELLVAVEDGRVVATGAATDLVTADLVEDVLGLRCVRASDPVTGRPSVYLLPGVLMASAGLPGPA